MVAATRRNYRLLQRAVKQSENYESSQPISSAVQAYKSGVIGTNNTVVGRHYLARALFRLRTPVAAIGNRYLNNKAWGNSSQFDASRQTFGVTATAASFTDSAGVLRVSKPNMWKASDTGADLWRQCS